MWNPFRRETHVLQSSLDPESCRARLAAETGSIWNPFAVWSHPVRGRVTARGFWIVKSIRYRNTFQTVASGRWSANGRCTRIEVTLGMNRWVAPFLIAWIAFLVAIAAMWWTADTMPETRGVPRGLADLIPFFMIVFALLLVAFGRWLARHDAADLLAFLSRTLECQPDATPIG